MLEEGDHLCWKLGERFARVYVLGDGIGGRICSRGEIGEVDMF